MNRHMVDLPGGGLIGNHMFFLAIIPKLHSKACNYLIYTNCIRKWLGNLGECKSWTLDWTMPLYGLEYGTRHFLLG